MIGLIQSFWTMFSMHAVKLKFFGSICFFPAGQRNQTFQHENSSQQNLKKEITRKRERGKYKEIKNGILISIHLEIITLFQAIMIIFSIYMTVFVLQKMLDCDYCTDQLYMLYICSKSKTRIPQKRSKLEIIC